MQRPRNRQPRDSNSNSSSRGRGNPRGGRPSHRNSPRSYNSSSSVPSFSALASGTPVSIVLKIDQPTGHQVRGIVADLLTRGDHPRGVKVRLRDGRVGRVQGLVSLAEGEAGEAVAGGVGANLGRDGENGSIRGRARQFKYTDVREEEDGEYEQRVSSLADYCPQLAQLEQKENSEVGRRNVGVEPVTARCPVCGESEGDEVAVAHHVEEHFRGDG
ncbi:uncharacterized protein BDZ99DRAFT_1135 [Mytilinidion resinicola]|uniref:Uncharacterized protein n=1 Tax=Mytilinidion resinicola TaxID=574789 RepID=A0A6A6Z7Q7_9PEZI|nr:uncharacterized protein BDZ99DRAFT_1135 [Mytilinidion resinicola]KAF2816769.1 hypothetical protein BDZ99DRAFT_1135 [Mytilinidion resinicola]